MKKAILIVLVLGLSGVGALAQERGKKIKKPNIPSNSKNTTKTDDAFSIEEAPTNLRFANEFEIQAKPEESSIKTEPIKVLSVAVSEDTSTVDENQPLIVEIEDEAQFVGSDEMIKIASYYSVWSTERVDPYGIDAKEFDDVIPIQLYDISQNRYWAGPLSKGVVNSNFGWRWKRWHTGQDLDLETGEPVYAAFDGIVRVASTIGAYGRCVVIRHYNGLETLYGHLSKINFEPNTVVKAGDEIGKGGSTGRSSGPHLHFETRYEGNPFDPRNIFTFTPAKININTQEFILSSRLYDYLRGGASKVDFEFDEPVAVNRKVWYKVRPGETLSEIAEKFQSTTAEIAKLNRIKTNTKLKTGYRLRVK